MKICKHCHLIFKPNSYHPIYCSEMCRKAAERKRYLKDDDVKKRRRENCRRYRNKHKKIKMRICKRCHLIYKKSHGKSVFCSVLCERKNRSWKTYYITNKEKILLHQKKYREENKDKIRLYREKNREYYRFKNKQYVKLLVSSYVVPKIKKQTWFLDCEITNEIIDLKRQELLFKRELKKTKGVYNGIT